MENERLTESQAKESVRRLIADSQAGNQTALASLRERYTPLIESCSSRFFREGMSHQDREDILEEALINFCNAVCSYDTSFEGVEFGLYAKICIENGLVSFMRSFDRRRKISALSLDEISGDGEKRGQSDMLDTLADREQVLLLANKIRACLSKYENKIWWMYVSGLSVREIAADIGVESKSVSNAIFRIRKKLKDMIASSEINR